MVLTVKRGGGRQGPQLADASNVRVTIRCTLARMEAKGTEADSRASSVLTTQSRSTTCPSLLSCTLQRQNDQTTVLEYRFVVHSSFSTADSLT